MVNQHRLFYMETGVLWHFSLRSTCNITEIEDPGGCEQTDSTDAEPREEARLPRSPRRPHPASRRFSAQKNMSPRCRSSSKHRSPLLPRWIKLLCFSSFFPIYRLWDILALVSIHDPGGCSRGSARHQHLSIQHQSVCQHRRSSSVHMHKLKTQADTQWIISLHLHIYKYLYLKNISRFRLESCPESDLCEGTCFPGITQMRPAESAFSWVGRLKRRGGMETL